jgi:hypothetical protein
MMTCIEWQLGWRRPNYRKFEVATLSNSPGSLASTGCKLAALYMASMKGHYLINTAVTRFQLTTVAQYKDRTPSVQSPCFILEFGSNTDKSHKKT